MILSIITINYNNVIGLKKTLKSVAYQTNTNFEHIIIDGASSDGSVSVIKQYEEEKKNCYNIYWISEKDAGVYDAMNKGILMAKGDYCLFLNSGDRLTDDDVIDEVLSLKLDADIVCGNAIYLESEYHKRRYLLSPDIIKASDIILRNLPHQSSFIRRQLFFDIHLYDTSFKVVSDWIFFIESILSHNRSYKHINKFVSTCEAAGISSQPRNCEMMENEFHRALKHSLPLFYDDYVILRSHLRQDNDIKQLFFNRLIKSSFGKYFWKIRNLFAKMGYYSFKKQKSTKQLFRKILKEDAKKKLEIEKKIETLPHNILKKQGTETDFVISLTSYGKRVSDAAPYAIYSLFTQSVLPDRIILYLDNNNWNTSNTPYLLRKLVDAGLEIRFCDDIKSFKKLIPALTDFPDSPIITVDDDFYYNPDYLKWMTKAYLESDRKTVLGQWGCIPSKHEGKYIPYSQWEDCKYGNEHSKISFFGCCCCYPPHIFDEEILKTDVFMKLCPTADDIWFWAQEERLNIKRKYIEPFGYGLNTPVNRIEEYDMSQKSTLFYENCICGKNDVQLDNVIKYYNL